MTGNYQWVKTVFLLENTAQHSRNMLLFFCYTDEICVVDNNMTDTDGGRYALCNICFGKSYINKFSTFRSVLTRTPSKLGIKGRTLNKRINTKCCLYVKYYMLYIFWLHSSYNTVTKNLHGCFLFLILLVTTMIQERKQDFQMLLY